jgi:hypothetical protein
LKPNNFKVFEKEEQMRERRERKRERDGIRVSL